MKFHNITLFSCCIVLIIGLSGAACSQKPAPGITYDPNKNYAAFLVINSDHGKTSLASMKQHTTDESYEIGPIEYYNPGTKDFVPALTRLTASKQVKIVWIISSLFDVNDIKLAMTKIDYAGTYRYAPISDQVGPIKVEK
jgi:hypothetical protein